MKPIENLSTEHGVLAAAYPCAIYQPLIEVCDAELRTTLESLLPRQHKPGPIYRPLLEVVDAEYRTTVETLLPRRHKPGVRPHAEYDAALADLGYSRTSTWRRQHGLAFCDVTTAQPNATD